MSWFAERRKRRDLKVQAAVLGCLVLGYTYALDIWKRVGGASGRIYVALSELERQGYVWSRPESDVQNSRRVYFVTRRFADLLLRRLPS